MKIKPTDINGTITVPGGGTGAVTLTGYMKGNGTGAVTASATIAFTDITGTVPVVQGGTGATTAAVARTNLGLDAGGAGDIWVEKAGDTMTGDLTILKDNVGSMAALNLTGYRTTSTGQNSTAVTARAAHGSVAVPAFVAADGAVLFNAQALSYNGVGFSQCAAFAFSTVGAHSATNRGTRFRLDLVAPASTALVSNALTFRLDEGIQFQGSAVIDGDRLHRLRLYTVATLPTAGTAGRVAAVTDALAPTFMAILVGGGAIHTIAYDNGTNWTAH